MSMKVLDVYRQAENDLLAKNYEKALAGLGAVIQADPGELRARFLVASTLEQMKATNRAFEVYHALTLHCLKAGYPLPGLVAFKKASSLQAKIDDLLDTIVELYSLESDRVDQDLPLPGLPELNGEAEVDGPLEMDDKTKHRVAQLAQTFPQGGYPRKLPAFPLLSLLTSETIFPILEIVETKAFRPGDPIVNEGDPCTSIYMLAFGEVEVREGGEKEGRSLAVLPAGSIFGEMALITDGPRLASARALRDSEVLEISLPELEAAAEDLDDITWAVAKFTRQRFLNNLMVCSPVFAPFSPEERKEILDRFASVGVMTDEVIIKEGEVGPGLYLILGGEVEVSKFEGGSQVHLATLAEGSVFGEISLVRDTPTTATVRATRGGEFLFLPREEFLELAEQRPEIRQALDALSGERLEEQRLALAREQEVSEDGTIIF